VSEIDPMRLAVEYAREAARQRVRMRPVEIASGRSVRLPPLDVAGDKHDQQPVATLAVEVMDRVVQPLFRSLYCLLVSEPMPRLTLAPFGLCGPGRGHQDNPAGSVERAGDRWPELRRQCQIGLVAKNVERPPAPPGLGISLQPRLQSARHLAGGGVT